MQNTVRADTTYIAMNANAHGRKTRPGMSDFYARKQNASRVFAIIWASVCPSVRLSVCHTRELYQNGAS